MRHSKYIYLLTCLIWGSTLISQISPGKLTSEHANLEGVSNCTKCHDLGNKVPDSKCLDCHEEINSLIERNTGYHASSEVKSLTCVDCHSEHHGRKFEMTRFDQDNFDHELTGYALEQKHSIVDCRECHTSDNIENLEIQKKEDTFLGLQQKCTSCHIDFHQGTLDNNCISCHDISGFRPAVNFDHSESNFNLNGAHVEVSCIECHEERIRNDKDFQEFSDLKFKDCIDCHSDPHNSLVGSCTQCHNENSFNNFIGDRKFKHSKTSFALNGKHRSVNCFDCHAKNMSVKEIFQDHESVINQDCIVCHEDTHKGKFGKKCVECHNEESWNQLTNLNLFDHNLTDFPLLGKHVEVDCKQCHISESFIDSINFLDCKNCHEDYHNGEFIDKGIVKDCDGCHVVESGFSYTTFSLDNHNEGIFSLDGAHLATPCFSCHVSEDHWTFKNIGSECVDCHSDIHENFIDEKYYPDQNCTACHQTESWTAIDFNHDLTDWSLKEKHLLVSCRDCHFESSGTEGEYGKNIEQKFVTLNSDCINCHDNVHGSQFEVNGQTNCNRCHDNNSWSPEKFDHSSTRFELTGKHKEIECRACHFEEETANGVGEVIYKIENFKCIDCHL